MQHLKKSWTQLVARVRTWFRAYLLLAPPPAEEMEEVPPVSPVVARPPITFTRPVPKLPTPTPRETPSVFDEEKTVASFDPLAALTMAPVIDDEGLDTPTEILWIPVGTTQLRISPRYRPTPKASRREFLWREPGQKWSRMELIPVKAAAVGEVFPVTVTIEKIGIAPGNAIEVTVAHGNPACMLNFSVEFLFL